MQLARALPAPALTAAGLVIQKYGTTAANWTEALRPLAAVVVGACLLALIIYALTRRPAITAAVSTALVILVMRPTLAPWVVLVVLVAAAVLYGRRIRGHSFQLSPKRVALVPALFVLVGLVGLVTSGAVTLDDFGIDAPRVQAGGPVRPSVYVLLLDGYPRADSLRDRFGIDNSAFLDGLEGQGLKVYDDATTLWGRTELSLASTMLADPSVLDQFMDDAPLIDRWRQARRGYLGANETMDALRAAGYRLVHIASPISHVQWDGWDVDIDSGQATDFEAALIQESMLSRVLDGWLLEQNRDRIDDELAAWGNSADPARQQIVFAHLMAPHPPFVYGQDRPLPCWYESKCSLYTVHVHDLSLTDAEYGTLLRDQLTGVNRRVIDAVRQVVTNDPGATVIVLSDHGGRFNVKPDEEWHRSLFAARVPGHVDLFDGHAGPDGLFLRIPSPST